MGKGGQSAGRKGRTGATATIVRKGPPPRIVDTLPPLPKLLSVAPDRFRAKTRGQVRFVDRIREHGRRELRRRGI